MYLNCFFLRPSFAAKRVVDAFIRHDIVNTKKTKMELGKKSAIILLIAVAIAKVRDNVDFESSAMVDRARV